MSFRDVFGEQVATFIGGLAAAFPANRALAQKAREMGETAPALTQADARAWHTHMECAYDACAQRDAATMLAAAARIPLLVDVQFADCWARLPALGLQRMREQLSLLVRVLHYVFPECAAACAAYAAQQLPAASRPAEAKQLQPAESTQPFELKQQQPVEPKQATLAEGKAPPSATAALAGDSKAPATIVSSASDARMRVWAAPVSLDELQSGLAPGAYSSLFAACEQRDEASLLRAVRGVPLLQALQFDTKWAQLRTNKVSAARIWTRLRELSRLGACLTETTFLAPTHLPTPPLLLVKAEEPLGTVPARGPPAPLDTENGVWHALAAVNRDAAMLANVPSSVLGMTEKTAMQLLSGRGDVPLDMGSLMEIGQQLVSGASHDEMMQLVAAAPAMIKAAANSRGASGDAVPPGFESLLAQDGELQQFLGSVNNMMQQQGRTAARPRARARPMMRRAQSSRDPPPPPSAFDLD